MRIRFQVLSGFVFAIVVAIAVCAHGESPASTLAANAGAPACKHEVTRLFRLDDDASHHRYLVQMRVSPGELSSGRALVTLFGTQGSSTVRVDRALIARIPGDDDVRAALVTDDELGASATPCAGLAVQPSGPTSFDPALPAAQSTDISFTPYREGRCKMRDRPSRVLRVVSPTFSAEMLALHMRGTVTVGVVLAPDSSVIDAVVLQSTSSILNQPTIDAARASTYESPLIVCRHLRSLYRFVVDYGGL